MMVRSLLLLGINITTLFGLGQPPYQLAPPFADCASVFFTAQQMATLRFAQPGTEIRYTLDGSDPTVQSERYAKPISIRQHGTVMKASSFGDGFLPSAIIKETFYQAGMAWQHVQSSAPNKRYAANGHYSLGDNLSGSSNFADGKWLGYDSDSVVITISLAQPKAVREVMIHALCDQGSWIFFPANMKLYGDGALLGNRTTSAVSPMANMPEAFFLPVGKTVQQITLVLYPVNPLPEWHDGKGGKAWIFMDEIMVY